MTRLGVLGLDFKIMYNFIMNFKLKIFTPLLVALFVFLPFLSFAQMSGNAPVPPAPVADSSPAPTTIVNPIGVDTIMGLIKKILEGVLTIALPIIALAFIYSGFLFVQAQGKPEELKTAKSAFIYSLIGGAILLGAWALAQLISETVLGVTN